MDTEPFSAKVAGEACLHRHKQETSPLNELKLQGCSCLLRRYLLATGN